MLELHIQHFIEYNNSRIYLLMYITLSNTFKFYILNSLLPVLRPVWIFKYYIYEVKAALMPY
jgi:hypothetical protein